MNLSFGGNNILSDLSLPSCAAAPPGMILVIKMLGSSPMWGLSVPPAILKPRPEFPCREGGKTCQNKKEKMSTKEKNRPLSIMTLLNTKRNQRRNICACKCYGQLIC